MKEAVKIIASAWSTAFIVLFLMFAMSIPMTKSEDHAVAYRLVVVLFVCAVTGVGWLSFRHIEKEHKKMSRTRKEWV